MDDKLIVKDHTVSNKEFTLRYDPKYHMYFTHPKPLQEELPAYYESADYISHTDGKRSFTELLYQGVKKLTLSQKRKIIGKYQSHKGLVLDLGCGTGDFISYLNKNHWNVIGVEPIPKARHLAVKKGLRVCSNIGDLETSHFDTITMWHVLEHVYHLDKQLTWLKDHLSEKGNIFIAVPNFESWDAQYYGTYWAAYDVPRHLYHFSHKAIAMLFQDVGLELVETIPMKFDAYYVSLLSEKYKTGNRNYVRALRSGFISNYKAKRSGNYSSKIYVLRHKK